MVLNPVSKHKLFVDPNTGEACPFKERITNVYTVVTLTFPLVFPQKTYDSYQHKANIQIFGAVIK